MPFGIAATPQYFPDDSLLTFLFLKIMIIFVVDMLANE